MITSWIIGLQLEGMRHVHTCEMMYMVTCLLGSHDQSAWRCSILICES